MELAELLLGRHRRDRAAASLPRSVVQPDRREQSDPEVVGVGVAQDLVESRVGADRVHHNGAGLDVPATLVEEGQDRRQVEWLPTQQGGHLGVAPGGGDVRPELGARILLLPQRHRRLLAPVGGMPPLDAGKRDGFTAVRRARALD